MTYQQRWLLAVAMKQGYPLPDTGATETAPAPPTFTLEEMAPAIDERTRKMFGVGMLAGIGLTVAAGVLVSIVVGGGR